MSKAAATRLALAVLAAAATLAVCGCGGDSATETASAPQSSAAGGGGQEQQEPSSSQSGASAKGQQAQAKEEAAATAAAGGSGSAAKHGAQIVAPKGPREPAPSAQQRAEAAVASMSLSSPALSPGPESVSILPAPYTCDGKDTWPTLRWAGVPADTAELVLFVLNLEPVNEALFFDWAVADIDPSLEGIESGQLPKGVVLGKNSFGKQGYSICPPPGKPETIIFALYALADPIGAQKGFDPMALRKQILAGAGNAGLMAVSYARG